jgi:hypothetical protein
MLDSTSSFLLKRAQAKIRLFALSAPLKSCSGLLAMRQPDPPQSHCTAAVSCSRRERCDVQVRCAPTDIHVQRLRPHSSPPSTRLPHSSLPSLSLSLSLSLSHSYSVLVLLAFLLSISLSFLLRYPRCAKVFQSQFVGSTFTDQCRKETVELNEEEQLKLESLHCTAAVWCADLGR